MAERRRRRDQHVAAEHLVQQRLEHVVLRRLQIGPRGRELRPITRHRVDHGVLHARVELQPEIAAGPEVDVPLPVQQDGAPVERVIVDVDWSRPLLAPVRHHFIQNRQALFSSRHVVPPGVDGSGAPSAFRAIAEVCRFALSASRPGRSVRNHWTRCSTPGPSSFRRRRSRVSGCSSSSSPWSGRSRRLHGRVQRAIRCPSASRACAGARARRLLDPRLPPGSFSLALEPVEAARGLPDPARHARRPAAPGARPRLPQPLRRPAARASPATLLWMAALFGAHAGRGDEQLDGDVARADGHRPGADPLAVAVGRAARLGDDPAPADLDRPELHRRRHDRRRRPAHPLAGGLDPRRARPRTRTRSSAARARPDPPGRPRRARRLLRRGRGPARPRPQPDAAPRARRRRLPPLRRRRRQPPARPERRRLRPQHARRDRSPRARVRAALAGRPARARRDARPADRAGQPAPPVRPPRGDHRRRPRRARPSSRCC